REMMIHYSIASARDHDGSPQQKGRSHGGNGAFERSLAASGVASLAPITGVGKATDEQIIRRCGRFVLTQSTEGIWWVLTTEGGSVWHWHAEGKQWIQRCHVYRTEDQASAGLEEALALEQAGELQDME